MNVKRSGNHEHCLAAGTPRDSVAKAGGASPPKAGRKWVEPASRVGAIGAYTFLVVSRSLQITDGYSFGSYGLGKSSDAMRSIASWGSVVAVCSIMKCMVRSFWIAR